MGREYRENDRNKQGVEIIILEKKTGCDLNVTQGASAT